MKALDMKLAREGTRRALQSYKKETDREKLVDLIISSLAGEARQNAIAKGKADYLKTMKGGSSNSSVSVIVPGGDELLKWYLTKVILYTEELGTILEKKDVETVVKFVGGKPLKFQE